MSFIVIEKWNGLNSVCTDEDGETLEFGSREEAMAEAAECQQGVIVEI
ncbi:hypothetical protein [Mucilaginibacter sp.]|nr:hypothetical protein [Mucilaginibacter sp.]